MMFSLGIALAQSRNSVDMHAHVQRTQRFDRVEATAWNGTRMLSRVDTQGLLLEALVVGPTGLVLGNPGVLAPFVVLIEKGLVLDEPVIAYCGTSVFARVRNLGPRDVHVSIALIGPVGGP